MGEHGALRGRAPHGGRRVFAAGMRSMRVPAANSGAGGVPLLKQGDKGVSEAGKKKKKNQDRESEFALRDSRNRFDSAGVSGEQPVFAVG